MYHNVAAAVPEAFKNLFTILEADFQPLSLWKHAQPAIDQMKEDPDLCVYVGQLQEVIVSKTVLQLSQVYQTLQFEEIFKLCPFMKPMDLERCVIELIHSLELPIRINNRAQAIIFDEFVDLGITQCDYGGQHVSQVCGVVTLR